MKGDGYKCFAEAEQECALANARTKAYFDQIPVMPAAAILVSFIKAGENEKTAMEFVRCAKSEGKDSLLMHAVRLASFQLFTILRDRFKDEIERLERSGQV